MWSSLYVKSAFKTVQIYIPVYLGDIYKNSNTPTRALYLITRAEWTVGGSEASSFGPDLQKGSRSPP